MQVRKALLSLLASVLVLHSAQAGLIASKVASVPSSPPASKQSREVIVQGDCNFKVTGDLADPAPLFVEPSTFEWIVPNPDGVVQIANGDSLDMYCDSFIAPFAGATKVSAQCLQGLYFLVEGMIYPLQNFTCTKWPTTIVRRTERSCNGGTDLLEAGFAVEDGFLQTLDICHNEDLEVTRYVHHVLNPSSAAYQHSVPRPSFAVGDFYGGKDVNKLYTQVQQNITISEILGLDASSYFNFSSDLYLARGHMAAKVDLIFGAQQMSTFFFVNVAPQWQTFNGANWERVEDGVRKFVGNNALTVDCYTGIWGVVTLPDYQGVPQELYLDFDANNNGLIPVPKLYYRVVIDRATREGVVLLGVNNPHATLAEIERDYIICEDVSDGIDWISWEKHNLGKGYSYACSVPDFTAVVKDLPLEDLETSGLLGVTTGEHDPDFHFEFL